MPDTAPAQDYRGTVFLPRTDFPMRADLPKREPGWLERWERIGLWTRLREKSKGRRKFVLHDGPPYANGNIHIGTALNKILKDAINRAAQMAGYDADYIPGWDCHGLPIEWKIEEEYRAKKKNKDEVPVLEFRAECRAFAEHWLAVQRDEFARLGVLGDWAGRYATMDLPSEAAIAREIGKFLMNGALYRGLRPVMWSPVEKTALAEAEIEYHDHKSAFLYACFPLTRAPAHDLEGANVVIWTTTPWTIPANRALAYGEEIDYALIHVEGVTGDTPLQPGRKLLVSLHLLPEVERACGIGAHTVIRVLKGAELAGAIAAHPLRDWAGAPGGYAQDIPLLPGAFVTAEAGTGFVHIAPSHGEDDFELGRAHGLPVPETVADDGTYTHHVPGFAGLHVFRAHDAVWEALAACGTLAGKGFLTHSYPHSWRSKKPVICRATPQWFIAMDGARSIRATALDQIAKTHFVPEAGRTRLGSMIAARPDWCISRQRAWGVPIAVFVDKRTGEPLRDQAVIDRIVEAFTTEGADAWYQPGAAARFLGPGRDPADYEQVMDIVDVWFESGSTHAFVLGAGGGNRLPFPADLYLEGSDQHRGWFHSSLLESVGTNGVAPFKAVLTHGFVLDEQGRKMSKSLGNTVAPQDVLKTHGADILRLWVMNADTTEDLRIGKGLLDQQAELYRRLRNTLRWLLGNLDGFTEAEAVPHDELQELERWVLHRLTELDAKLRAAADPSSPTRFAWTGVYPEIHAFCAADLSAFWFDIRKDAFYCDRADSHRRRSARTVADILHRTLCLWLAPVLVFTAEEAWLARFPSDTDSVHLHDWPAIPAAWRDKALEAKWNTARDRRRHVTVRIEEMRRADEIGSSLQAAVVLRGPAREFSADGARYLGVSAEEWADILIVSHVSFEVASGLPFEPTTVTRADGKKCDRCWKVLPEVGHSAAHPTLCRRCEAAIAP